MNPSSSFLNAKSVPAAIGWHPWQQCADAGRAVLHFLTHRIVAPLLAIVRGVSRGVGLMFVIACALADAGRIWLASLLTKSGRSKARSRWLHRWSRVALRALGLRAGAHGHAPVSGIVVANYASLLDALLLAAIHPCVFVAGPAFRHGWPVRLLARLAGTIFIASRRSVDLQLANFAIERAVLRRQIVVIFSQCNPQRGFATTLFQPAVELGCTLTAAAIHYETGERRPIAEFGHDSLGAHLAYFMMRRRSYATATFDSPRFHGGSRKQLARQVRGEIQNLRTPRIGKEPCLR